jgi:hypothetical protein
VGFVHRRVSAALFRDAPAAAILWADVLPPPASFDLSVVDRGLSTCLVHRVQLDARVLISRMIMGIAV